MVSFLVSVAPELALMVLRMTNRWLLINFDLLGKLLDAFRVTVVLSIYGNRQYRTFAPQ